MIREGGMTTAFIARISRLSEDSLFRQITAVNHQFTDEFLEELMPWSEKVQENC